jgi:hypothetical protein
VILSLAASSLATAGDLSSYRNFRFGMPLSAIAKEAAISPEGATALYTRPALIQELRWEPNKTGSGSPGTDSVGFIAFDFCDNSLYQMTITYDYTKTRGMVDQDVIKAVSGIYGTATDPGGEIEYYSNYHQRLKVIARWEDAQYSFSLVRSSFPDSFAIVGISKTLAGKAQAVIAEAQRLDEIDAPRKLQEIRDRRIADARAEDEKNRATNQPAFRP